MFNNTAQWLISKLLTSFDRGRIRVDVGQTGFWEGREFRLDLPLSIATSTRFVLRVTAPIDFVIQLQRLSVSETGIRFQAYRSIQGTPSGSWATVETFKNNGMSDTPAYTKQVIVDSGGAFAVTGGQLPVETIELLVSGSTAQQSTVSGSTAKERGLPAGTYYLVFTNYTGSGTAKGIYDLIYEERS
jgi:hypothetical protein